MANLNEAKNGQEWFYLSAGNEQSVSVVDKSKTMPVDGTLSIKFKMHTDEPEFGIYYSYLDDEHWLYVGRDTATGWFYEFKHDDFGMRPKIEGLPTPVNAEEMDVEISLSHETLKVTVNGITAAKPRQALMNLMTEIDGKGSFGIKVIGSDKPISFTDVKQNTTDCMEDSWECQADGDTHTFENRFIDRVKVAGNVVDDSSEQTPLAGIIVRIGANQTTTDENGNFCFDGILSGRHNASVSGKGYQSYIRVIQIDEEVLNFQFVLPKKTEVIPSDYYTLKSGDMTVYAAKNFPRVLRYDIGGSVAFKGQEYESNTLKINNISVVPAVAVNGYEENQENSSIDYVLDIQNEAAKLNLEMTVRISVDGRNLTWEVTGIEKKDGCAMIGTIDIPNLNLITIDAYPKEVPEGADWEYGFIGAGKSTNTTVSGDRRITFEDGFVSNEKAGYLYAFLSENGYSAGLFSNSEAEGDQRIIRVNGADTISLNSAPWYYELGDKGGQIYETAQLGYRRSELPVAKVCIADDLNHDGKVDWQDAAIAFRSIMNNPVGNERIKDCPAYRIVMNFASAAPNPFLKTADNIKKVYLATDGLAQSVMLKGYGNEGHDSANSEYADIAEREGGLEDFLKLIKIAHQYNTHIGVHVNAQEVYAEAASFNEDMIGASKEIENGWDWLDQAHKIDKLWDLQTDARYKRFIQFYDRINGTHFYSKAWDVNDKHGSAVGKSTGEILATMAEIYENSKNRPDNMDFIYLDVWYQNSWETRRIAEEINSLGWDFTTEFSDQGEYNSIWQHWATDATYGGAGMKGFNSEVIRFIRNHQRDSQVLNYPQFGGTADKPLLGGFRLRGFEGWSGNNNFSDYIYYTFKDNLPTRFLQHYEIMKWVDDAACPTGNKEKEITLVNQAGDTVIVTRNDAQREDEEITREITLNGKTVLSCTPDHSYYLLPWTDEDGSKKLYHWNLEGGDSTWQLTEEWNGTVYLYKLTDQGRTCKQVLTVENGVLNITGAEAGVPYVLVKTESVKTLKADFGEFDYVVDPGFNGYEDMETLNPVCWSGDLDKFVVKKGHRGDQYVEVADLEQTAAASTRIRNLTKDSYYVAEIYVDNRSDARAYLEVKNGSELVSNYTEKSIAPNYTLCDEHHTTDVESYMQHILVSFKAQDTTAVLTLKREAGEGVTMWSDIRVVEQKIDNYQADGSFRQDFESVVQGLYPFVLGPAQGMEDDAVTHLSERHDPYTKKGWNGRVIDDVIEGNWSLKHHGTHTGIIYQTIPQNFRFEAGKRYKVEFDYQTGANEAYAMVIGNCDDYEIPTLYAATTNGTEHGCLHVVGGENGQTWIGLYCNGSNKGKSMGQIDFVLDNLVITEE